MITLTDHLYISLDLRDLDTYTYIHTVSHTDSNKVYSNSNVLSIDVEEMKTGTFFFFWGGGSLVFIQYFVVFILNQYSFFFSKSFSCGINYV